MIRGLNRHYYSIAISYRKNELEQRILMNLHKKKWSKGLILRDFEDQSNNNAETVEVGGSFANATWRALCTHNRTPPLLLLLLLLLLCQTAQPDAAQPARLTERVDHGAVTFKAQAVALPSASVATPTSVLGRRLFLLLLVAAAAAGAASAVAPVASSRPRVAARDCACAANACRFLAAARAALSAFDRPPMLTIVQWVDGVGECVQK